MRRIAVKRKLSVYGHGTNFGYDRRLINFDACQPIPSAPDADAEEERFTDSTTVRIGAKPPERLSLSPALTVFVSVSDIVERKLGVYDHGDEFRVRQAIDQLPRLPPIPSAFDADAEEKRFTDSTTIMTGAEAQQQLLPRPH